MALTLKSAQRRYFWGSIAFSLGIEYLVILIVCQNVLRDNPSNWAIAFVWLLGIQLALLVYKIFSVGRRTVWYYLFERDVRSSAIYEEFNRLNFPRPSGIFNDADEYLQQVALSPATSPEGAMFASMLMGALNGHRVNGPYSEAWFMNLCIERAMKKMLPWEARTLL